MQLELKTRSAFEGSRDLQKKYGPHEEHGNCKEIFWQSDRCTRTDFLKNAPSCEAILILQEMYFLKVVD